MKALVYLFFEFYNLSLPEAPNRKNNFTQAVHGVLIKSVFQTINQTCLVGSSCNST